MPTDPKESRRSFLKASAATAAGLAALGVPAVNVLGANEKLNIGLIGTGGRCQHLMRALARIPDARMAALCDIYDVHLEQARKMADPKAFATKHYQEILNRQDIDAVLIASPDHWHVPMTIDACAAGKDVYVEKPLTHNLAEGKAVIEAQNQHERIVQVGTQQRSMPQVDKGREIVRSGRLGDIHKVHLTWNRNSDRARKGPQLSAASASSEPLSRLFISSMAPDIIDSSAPRRMRRSSPPSGICTASNWIQGIMPLRVKLSP